MIFFTPEIKRIGLPVMAGQIQHRSNSNDAVALALGDVFGLFARHSVALPQFVRTLHHVPLIEHVGIAEGTGIDVEFLEGEQHVNAVGGERLVFAE